MKKRMVLLGLITLTAMTLTPFAGCQSGSTVNTLPADSNITSPSNSKSTNLSDSEPTDNPLKKMSPVYFEETVNGIKNRFWIKGDRIRLEIADLSEVYLEDTAANTQIIYNPDDRTAYKSYIQEAGESLISPFYGNAFTGEDTEQDVSRFSQQQLEQAGIAAFDQLSESWDGKDCQVTIITFLSGETIKSWVWKEKDITLRYEMTGTLENTPPDENLDSGDTTVTMFYELHNFDFRDIPDFLFEVPAGFTITELPAAPYDDGEEPN
jgi:hypothetical protein